MKNEIISNEKLIQTSKQIKMETRLKNPVGRPKGIITRKYRTFRLTDGEFLKVKKFINRIKEVE